MAVILRETIRCYNLYINELSDQRSIDWPLMRSPIPVLSIVGVYLYFVRKTGPAFMKNRQPYQLDKLIQIYNVIQVILCSYLVFEGVTKVYGPWGHYSFICQPLDFSDSPISIYFLKRCYLYFALKILDLLDTIFFVLRKKQSQVTFLHVYHHALMVLLVWFSMRFTPGSHFTYIGIINSFVHSVMYAYYFITNYDKEYRKNVWWKKHITQLQLFQFGSVFVHASMPLFFSSDCIYPKAVILLLIPQNLFIFVLFLDFYKKTYLRPQTIKENPVK